MTSKKEGLGRTVVPASVEAATAPSAAAFTPGPWFLNPRPETDRDGGQPVCTYGLGNGRNCIANVWGMASARVIDDAAMANARLIAAAPELLEALLGILEGIEDESGPNDGVDGVVLIPLFESQIATARAAIAKATGQ